MLYLSQMTRDMTRLTDVVFVTEMQDMNRVFGNLSVTYDQGYD